MLGYVRAALLMVALALVQFGVASPAMAESVLRRGTASEPPSIDPHLAAGDSSSVIIDDLFLGLMTSGPKAELAHGAAESHSLSADGVTYVFKLRPGLKWSDGKPIDSSDVVYSFRRLMTPETAARYAGNLYAIKNAAAVNTGKLPLDQLGVRALDPSRVEITLEKPTPYFLEILRSNVAAIVPRHAIEAHDKTWTRAGRMVTNGAYKLTEWLPNTHIKLEKNPNYWDAAKVKIDTVYYYPTSDLGTMLKRYQAGELDVIFNFPPEKVEWIQANLAKELQVAPDFGLFYWLLNTKRAPFDDVRVRKALAISVDKDAIAKRLLKGVVQPAWGAVPPGFEDYTSMVTDYDKVALKTRQAEARKLLAAAGYTAAKPLKFELRFDAREESRQIAVAVAAMWSAIGVKADLKTGDFRSLTADVARGAFDMARYQWFSPYDDPVTFLNLLRGGSRTNHSGYANPAVDALLAKADMEMDERKRMALMGQAEALAMADHAIIPVYFPVARRLIKPRVKNWLNVPGGKVRTQYLAVD